MEQAAPDDAPPKKKKPYRKPEFVYERAFETLALSCGKLGSTTGQCKLSFNRS